MDVLAIFGVFALSLTLGLLGTRALLESILYLMTHAASQRRQPAVSVSAPRTAAAFLADDVGAATLRVAG
jgi:hypothetical protein